MATFVSELDPTPVWQQFDRLLAIPRPSKQEARAREHVLALARAAGLAARTDAAGNVVVAKPASAGHTGAPAVILQSHLDMVGEKNSDVTFDFSRDAIVPRRDGDWLKASGTTLGADNGIGVAMMLAIAEDRALVHPPLELLFTIDEETGLTGATELDPGMLSARRLLNLDSEEEGALYVGCAGGAGTDLRIPIDTMFGAEGREGLAVRVSGLLGGHSGGDIHLGRGNSLKVLGRLLDGLVERFDLEIGSITGGNLHNAIPREAEAKLRIGRHETAAFRAEIASRAEEIRSELTRVDPGLSVEVVGAKVDDRVIFSTAAGRRIVALLDALPHGVLAMSAEIPGLVETSTNLARVRTEGEMVVIHHSNRSSIGSALRATQRRIAAFASLAGGDAHQHAGYPGWRPDLDSPLLAAVAATHRRVVGKDAEIKAIHAGLECGLIGEKIPGMEMLSFGPVIEAPHSPDERVLIPSVGRFWTLLTAVLADLAS